ncbi:MULTISPECIES: MFS transporter [unclassified Bacillus (in: firmicutes)]|uniref:MFS transporter n=1 Tax=unclassified Bacillus (in: firmicutes) TaxID=185979 RepID=UPI001CB8F6F0|nr:MULTISPECIES: MFS transporter [unclassified Bacillus (in: firmicutes)]
MTIFGFASVFTAFTYISPILLQVTGFQENGVTLILVLFGLGVTIRNLVGGKLADWKLMPSIIVLLILLMAVLLLFTITSEFKVPAVLTIFVWGIISFILVPTLQYRTMNMAHEAPTLASTTQAVTELMSITLFIFFLKTELFKIIHLAINRLYPTDSLFKC